MKNKNIITSIIHKLFYHKTNYSNISNNRLRREWPNWAEYAVATTLFEIPRTSYEQIALGKEMHFSVGNKNYIDDVKAGKYIIISYIGSLGEKCTLQIDYNNPFHIYQNKGSYNNPNVSHGITI